MPISAALAARLGPGPGPARRRLSPYARPNEACGGGTEAGRPPLRAPAATTKREVPAPFAAPPDPAPATAGPGRRSEVAASVPRAYARWRPRGKMVSQRPMKPGWNRWSRNAAASAASAPGSVQKAAATVGSGRGSEVAATIAAAPAPTGPCPGDSKKTEEPNLISNPARGEEKPPADEKRDGGGGFVFQVVLEGHTSEITGISLPQGSDKLYSGSADGTILVWDCHSGKQLTIQDFF